jgi:CP family cyanate transporter-like MFS transporter
VSSEAVLVPRAAPRETAAFALAVVLVALNLRAFLTASGPLLDAIRQDTGLGFRGVALLTLLPMFAIGPMSLGGMAVGRRLGERHAITLGVFAIGLACASRWIFDTAWALLASAAVAGLGVGLVQALMPAVIKRAYPRHLALAMGLYSAALMGGGALGALGSPWMAQATGHWSAALAVWVVPAIVAVLGWSRIAAATPDAAPARVDVARVSFTHPRAWLLALWFGLMNGGYTSLVAWLPHFYEERGWHPQQAGAMLAWMTVAQVSGALLLPAVARGGRDLRPWFACALLLQLLGFGALLADWPWPLLTMLVLGFGLGGAFSLVLVLALEHLPDPARAATLAGFMQGVGFMIAALAPLLAGWLREAAGSFDAVWCYLALIVLLLLPVLLRFDPRGYARAMAGWP